MIPADVRSEDEKSEYATRLSHEYKVTWRIRACCFILGIFLAVFVVSEGGIYLTHINDFVFALFMVLSFGFGFWLVYSLSPTDIYESFNTHSPFPERRFEYLKLGLATGIALSLIGFLIYPFLPK